MTKLTDALVRKGVINPADLDVGAIVAAVDELIVADTTTGEITKRSSARASSSPAATPFTLPTTPSRASFLRRNRTTLAAGTAALATAAATTLRVAGVW